MKNNKRNKLIIRILGEAPIAWCLVLLHDLDNGKTTPKKAWKEWQEYKKNKSTSQQ